MSTPILACIAQRQSPKPELIRKTAGFHPSLWGDRFLNYTPKEEEEDTMTHARIKELKKDVTSELMVAAAAAASEPSSSSSSSRQLNLIDAIQRLGVSYHFETEIGQALQHICQRYHNYDEDDSLYSVALRFRLLRQEGFDVSSDVFNKFKDGKGNFKESLIGDMMGMLCLYEATHLLKHGENILEEAMTFTTTHLVSSMATTTNFCNSLTPPQVMHALEQPIRKGLPRLEARNYIPIYEHEQDGSHNQALLDLAKLDFNHLQSLHKKELCDITRWWKDLNFATKLPYARDRVVEGYFWILGVYFEPQYSLARTILTKVIAMTSVIDDTYDVYGTFEELQLFTEAIRRWNMSSIDELPEYMKLCYKALLDVYEEIEEEMCKRGGQSYRTHYAIQAMKELVGAYFVEAKWLQEDYTPTMEEYMGNALVSSGYYVLITTSFVGMGEIVTKEAFDWVFSDPKIVRASAMISRLMDDIVSHKFEQKRGHVASAIECYMKQYNVPEQQVYEDFRNQIANGWKDINQECLRPTVVPMPLLTRIVNLTRVADFIYRGRDGYTHVGPEVIDRIASLLIDPMPTGTGA